MSIGFIRWLKNHMGGFFRFRHHMYICIVFSKIGGDYSNAIIDYSRARRPMNVLPRQMIRTWRREDNIQRYSRVERTSAVAEHLFGKPSVLPRRRFHDLWGFVLLVQFLSSIFRWSSFPYITPPVSMWYFHSRRDKSQKSSGTESNWFINYEHSEHNDKKIDAGHSSAPASTSHFGWNIWGRAAEEQILVDKVWQ